MPRCPLADAAKQGIERAPRHLRGPRQAHVLACPTDVPAPMGHSSERPGTAFLRRGLFDELAHGQFDLSLLLESLTELP